MTETNVSNCLIATIGILTITLFVWTVNIMMTVNQIITPMAISAFSA